MQSSSFNTPSFSSPRVTIADVNKTSYDLWIQVSTSSLDANIQSQFEQLKRNCQELIRNHGRILKIRLIEDRISRIQSYLPSSSSEVHLDDDTTFFPSSSESSLAFHPLSSSLDDPFFETDPSFPVDPLEELESTLTSLRNNPCKTFIIVDKHLKGYPSPEITKMGLKYLLEALKLPLDVWDSSNTTQLYPRKARSLAALHIAHAYSKGELPAPNRKERLLRTKQYYDIAMEKYGPEEKDYLGISYYNYACYTQKRIDQARSRGVEAKDLAEIYRKCLNSYKKSLEGNSPIKRSPEVLYKLAYMYYQMVQLKTELGISDRSTTIFVGQAFRLCLEALSIDQNSTQRVIFRTLEKENNLSRWRDPSEIQALLLLGHLLTQDYFIPWKSVEEPRFETLEHQRECGYFAYKAAALHSSSGDANHIDALCWAIESCTFLKNAKRGQVLAKALLPRLSTVRNLLSDEEANELKSDLEKLRCPRPLLAKLDLL